MHARLPVSTFSRFNAAINSRSLITEHLVHAAPRELGELRRACPNSFYCESCAMYRENDGTCGNESLRLNRPPQSWCYVEEM